MIRPSGRGRARRSAAVAALVVLCAACQSLPLPGGGEAVVLEAESADPRLERLAIDFYGRLANRRIDSLATYQDPSLREYFQSESDFADYYADLVQTLVEHWFDARRLDSVQIEGFEERDAGVVLRLRLHGQNSRPLRFWSTEVEREDLWVRGDDGRWWIEPGKV